MQLRDGLRTGAGIAVSPGLWGGKEMRLLILGAGATGGYFGGRLAEAGRDVTFLVRPGRAEQLARDGLVVTSPHGDIRRPVSTVTGDALAPDYDAVILTCKAYDLDDALAAIAPGVGPETRIVPLLNGMRHLDRLDAAFGPGRVLGGLCAIAATLTADGSVKHLNKFHLLTFGERDGTRTPFCEALGKDLTAVGFDARFSTIILQEMWEKWVMLATLAAMTCLMRAGVGAILEAAEGEALILETLDECSRIATAAGYPPRDKHLERTRAMLTERGSGLAASMLRDIEGGGRIEADHVIGDLLGRARAHGVDAPLLRVAFCHLQTYEAGRC
jgi:2-dehydropantoate 2-reductase